MFIESQFQTLFAYHWHTTTKLLALAETLGDAAYHENPGYGHGSRHDLFFHLLRTDSSWLAALETGKQVAGVKPEEFSDLASLRAGFAETRRAWQTYLDALTAEQIQNDIDLLNWRGDKFTLPLWRILQHLAFHRMQHHTEIAALLTAKGQSPGDIDFLFYR